MSTSTKPVPIWSILSIALIPLTMLCAVLAAITTDAFVIRPEPASITTLLPGWTYAAASVMKVCLIAGLISAGFALVSRARLSWLPRLGLVATAASDALHEQTPAKSSENRIPIWGLLSVALPPCAPLLGAVTALIAQTLIDKTSGISISHFPLISRVSVLIMLAWIAAGTGLGIMSLLKRESPQSPAALGVITNAFLIGLFWWFKFYQLGFDQDRWAAP